MLPIFATAYVAKSPRVDDDGATRAVCDAAASAAAMSPQPPLLTLPQHETDDELITAKRR